MLVFKAWRKSPALTQETTPSQRRITRILSDAQQEAAREFEQNLSTVADLLSRGQVDRVLTTLPTEPWLVAQEALAAELLGELLDAGSRVTLPSIEKATLAYSFDRERPESSQWARNAAGGMISQITGEQRNVVRDVVSAAALGELDWADVAQRVRGSIGLTTQQAGWVANHYDRAYLTAIRSGMGTAQAAARARESASRYQTSVHRYRANTIARTETMRAASEGRMQAWNQGLTQGFISPLWEKEWVAEASACDICVGMNGKRVAVKGSFPVGEPPAHPNCRCDVILVPPKVQPAGGGLGSTAFSALSTFDDLLMLGKIPLPDRRELEQWRMAYNLTTQRGEQRSFGEWMNDILEPDITVHAMEGEEGQKKWLDALLEPDEAIGNSVDLEDLIPDYDDLDIDRKQRDALQDYQFSAFYQINGRLRGGGIMGEYTDDVRWLDSLFDIVPAFRVTNGEFFRTLDESIFDGLRRGDTFIENGYMSTSALRSAALEFGEDSGYDGKMRIIDTAGISKIWVERITRETGFGQDEVLFARGTRLTYLGRDRDGWHVFTTVQSPRPAAAGPPVKPTFLKDDDFLNYDDNWGKWTDALDQPGRYYDIDPETRRAVQWYMGDGYRRINSFMLSDNQGEWSDDVRQAAYLLDMLYEDSTPLSTPIRVWRGLSASDFLGDLAEGSTFVSKSFMSTTGVPAVADEFMSEYGKSPALLRINAPRGSEAILLPDSDELEVLFRPGTKMKVIKVVMQSVPGVNRGAPVKVIYVEVRP